MKVTIYTMSSIAGPTVKDGRYAGIIEFIDRNGKSITRTAKGEEKESTQHRLILIAMIESMRMLKDGCEVQMVTDSKFISGQIQRDAPNTWERAEWKKSNGDEVKNKNLWEEYLQEAKRHQVEIVCEKRNKYSKDLLKMVTEK